MIREKTLEEFLALIARIHPQDRARAFTAYQFAGASPDWIAEGQKHFPPKSSFILLAKRFSLAMLRWLAAGCPLVSRLVLRYRARICAACQFWRPQARLGMGKCDHPECCCTKFKRVFGTEVCPANKWPAWTSSATPPKAP